MPPAAPVFALASVLGVTLALLTTATGAQTDARHPDEPARTHAAVPKPTGSRPAQRPAAHPVTHPAQAPHPTPPKPAPAPAAAPPVATVVPPTPAEPAKGSNTGLPLPRFASLKTDEVNLRAGPGTRYPIDWVYKRRDLPVQIEREFEVWRLIADPEGVKGWVHQATLAGRRSLVVTGGEQVIRSDPSDTASPVARVKPGVVGRLRACDANAAWCQVQVGDYRGWLKRDAFWGSFPAEAVQ